MARKDKGGVVLLSEFSSAHEFINGALSLNPWDINDIVTQLEKAIEMSDNEVFSRQTRDLDSIVKREKRLWSSQVIQNLLDSHPEEAIQTSRVPGAVLTEDDVNSIQQHLDVGMMNVMINMMMNMMMNMMINMININMININMININMINMMMMRFLAFVDRFTV